MDIILGVISLAIIAVILLKPSSRRKNLHEVVWKPIEKSPDPGVVVYSLSRDNPFDSPAKFNVRELKPRKLNINCIEYSVKLDVLTGDDETITFWKPVGIGEGVVHQRRLTVTRETS
jgi:hypothetical protein